MQLKNRRTIHRGDDGGIYKAHRTDPGAVDVFRKDTEKADDVVHVRVPISSTSQDRDGDRFGSDGLDRMVEQLQAGEVPLFLDHGISPETGWQDYRALEAIGGWVDGETEGETTFGIAALDPDKEEAQELARTLENGVVPMGWSVGFRPTEKRDADDIEGEEFGDHDLLEVSAVGIPSNPDAVSASVTLAAKGMAEQRGLRFDEQQFVRSFDSALRDASEKQDTDDYETAVAALDTYADEGGSGDDTVEEFLTWVDDTKSDDEAESIRAVVDEYLQAVDADAAEATVGELASWATDTLDDMSDGDGEEEGDGGDGDEDEDEDDEEESSAPPAVDLSDEQLDAIAERTATKLVDDKELVDRTEAAAEHGAKQGVEKLIDDAEQNGDGDGDGDDPDDDDDDDDDDPDDGGDGDGDGGKSGSGSGTPRGMATGVETEQRDTEQTDKNDDDGQLTGPFDDSKI